MYCIIDPSDSEVDAAARNVPSRYGQRFTTPPLDLEDQNEAFSMAKPPLVRNASLSFYDSENRHKEKVSKADSSGSGRK